VAHRKGEGCIGQVGLSQQNYLRKCAKSSRRATPQTRWRQRRQPAWWRYAR